MQTNCKHELHSNYAFVLYEKVHAQLY